MTGAHPGQTRMRGVSVIVPAGVDAEVFRMPLLEKALDTHLECRHWAIPHAMLPVLGQLFDRPWQDGIDALWREGVALQLLALGLERRTWRPTRCARCAPASAAPGTRAQLPA